MKDREVVMDDAISHDDWRSFFSEFAPGLLLFARQWTRSRADAEDIVQEAFVRFWRHNYKIDNPKKIGARGIIRSRALLYATVRSIALDRIRRDQRRARREAEAVSYSEQLVEPQFECGDEGQVSLAAAVERLPHEQREVLIMKIWNELTFAEIASALGISQNTAASRYRYALAALRKIFQPQ
jgi:RNA polymerase sigma-70 factor, ECF subfamily